MKAGRIITIQDYEAPSHDLYYICVTIETAYDKYQDVKIDFPNKEELVRGLNYWAALYELSESLHENGGSEIYGPDEMDEYGDVDHDLEEELKEKARSVRLEREFFANATEEQIRESGISMGRGTSDDTSR
jgi:hypothetical protein